MQTHSRTLHRFAQSAWLNTVVARLEYAAQERRQFVEQLRERCTCHVVLPDGREVFVVPCLHGTAPHYGEVIVDQHGYYYQSCRHCLTYQPRTPAAKQALLASM